MRWVLLSMILLGCNDPTVVTRCEEPSRYVAPTPSAEPIEVSVEVPDEFDPSTIEDTRTAVIWARDFVEARRFIDASLAYSRAIVLAENPNPTVLCEAAKVAHTTNQPDLALERFDRAERLLRRMPSSLARDGANAECFRARAEITEDRETAVELYERSLALNHDPELRAFVDELVGPRRRR